MGYCPSYRQFKSCHDTVECCVTCFTCRLQLLLPLTGLSMILEPFHGVGGNLRLLALESQRNRSSTIRYDAMEYISVGLKADE